MTPADQLPIDLSQPSLPAVAPGMDPIEAARQLALARPTPAAPPSPNRADYPSDEAFLLAHPGGISTLDPVPQQAAPAAAEAAPAAAVAPSGATVLEPLPQPEALQYSLARVPGASSSTSGSSGISKQSEARIRGAQEHVFNAVAGEIEAQAPQRARDAAAAEQVAALADERARLSAKYTIEAANLRDKNAKDAGDMRVAIDKDVADYQLAGDKIDPNRVWHRMDTGNKIAFALAAGLQGFASGLQGRGGNIVLEMLTSAQDRDLHAQEIGLNAKARGVQMRESMYSRLVEAGHDREISLLATRDASNHTIADQIAAAQAAATTASAQERAAVTAAGWQTKMATDRQQLEQAVARHTTSSNTTQSQMAVVDQYGRPAADPGMAIPGTKVKDAAVAQRVMSDKGQAEQVRKLASGLKTGLGAVRDMIKIREKYGTELWNEDATGEMAAQQALFTGAMGQASGSGTVNAGEFPRFQKLAPDLSPKFSDAKRLVGGQDPTLLRLKGLEKTLAAAADRSLGSYGLSIDSGRGEPVKQIRGSDGVVKQLFADGRVEVLR